MRHHRSDVALGVYSDKKSGPWTHEQYGDGSSIVLHKKGKREPAGHFKAIIERCRHPGHPRTKWHIVCRHNTSSHDMEPPIFSGPYPNLKTAKIAYLLSWVD